MWRGHSPAADKYKLHQYVWCNAEWGIYDANTFRATRYKQGFQTSALPTQWSLKNSHCEGRDDTSELEGGWLPHEIV